MRRAGRDTSVARVFLPGATYFTLVFALGFALGMARTLLVGDASRSVRLVGVLVELPIMLWASWLLCGVVVRRFAVRPAIAARLLMGTVAFVLLMLAEGLIAALLLGRTPAEHLASYAELSHALGLAAQLAFALMPTLMLWRREPQGPD